GDALEGRHVEGAHLVDLGDVLEDDHPPGPRPPPKTTPLLLRVVLFSVGRSTRSPSLRPLVTSVVLSPTTPVSMGVMTRVPSPISTVTVAAWPRRLMAEEGTTR